MNKIIAESENTSVGTVQVILKDDGAVDVQTTGSKDSSTFVVRHPDGDLEMAVRALGHYLHNEAHSNSKAQAQLVEIKSLLSAALNQDASVFHTHGSFHLEIMRCSACNEQADTDDEDGVQHLKGCAYVAKVDAIARLRLLIGSDQTAS